MKPCRGCEIPVDETARACPKCGARDPADPDPNTQLKGEVILLVLVILFASCVTCMNL